jgi:hypothetical protein
VNAPHSWVSDTGPTEFRKSSFSLSGNCVEVAFLPSGDVGVRHSRAPQRGTLTFTASEWEAFVRGVRAGEFDPHG